ncbi:DUF3658 domain-containing protein [Priestia filamentosa]
MEGIYKCEEGVTFLSSQKRGQLEKEWRMRSQTAEVLRIGENNHIHSMVDYYYDHYILNTCLSLYKE